MDKPTKPTDLIPRSFGGVKNNFSSSLQSSGYEDGVPAIYGGDNLNYQLDATGKELDYCEKIVDFINDTPIGKTITVDSNNKFVYENYSTVAKTGDYNDLLNKPTIPTSDSFANKSLNNLNATGQAILDNKLNRSQITDCILETPNGGFSVSGATITVGAGLKVLAPNGRNANTSMKNLEYTLPATASFTYTYGLEISMDVLYLDCDTGSLVRLQREYTGSVKTYSFLPTPQSGIYFIYYIEDDNKYYKSDNGGAWDEAKLVKVGYTTVNTSNIITGFYTYTPVKILTNSDMRWVTNWSFPARRWINLSLGASGSTYTAPANGYFYASFGNAGGASCYAKMINTSTNLASQNQLYSNYGNIVMVLPFAKGDVLVIKYSNIVGLDFKFVYAIGEQ